MKKKATKLTIDSIGEQSQIPTKEGAIAISDFIKKSQAQQISLPAKSEDSLSLESLFGAYKTEESAEEIIAELRDSNVSTRTIEPL